MSHRYDELIVDAMRTLAGGAGSEGSPIGSSLAELTATAVSLIDRVDCADVLMISGGTFESISATRPVARELDQVQQQTGAGPCLDAADRDVMVRCSDLANDDRWPEYAEHAQAVGVFSVMSFRLFTQGSDSGALNLLGFRPRTFTDEEEALGAMLATQAALLILAATGSGNSIRPWPAATSSVRRRASSWNASTSMRYRPSHCSQSCPKKRIHPPSE